MVDMFPAPYGVGLGAYSGVAVHMCGRDCCCNYAVMLAQDLPAEMKQGQIP